MNAKYALALILTLQVSMSLCDIPPPSDELLAKYTELKTTFYKRIMNAIEKLQNAVAPMLEGSTGAQVAIDYGNRVGDNPRVKAGVQIVQGLASEAGPLVDHARSKALGAYEQKLRPYIGTQLDSTITDIKWFLDKILPAE